ncbi:hypothetical protein F6A13_03680 [Acidithiobacillus sp. 'AMD consortium']|uniref:methylamine utilization protein MauJ n=1 Tax=Acidithiobacillus sp. 'AMD consortium' TaxID=2614801 RepID=UPI00124DCA65|nr:methylamine utilization protein MauJ [Acidithiobacillus sp. 'AMD consortium']QFG77836.1 hypothetical protein F6A13_03680 [Acidithiobacillus sp. 'AMD consortium']
MSRKKTTLKTRGGARMTTRLSADKFAPPGISGDLFFVPQFGNIPAAEPVQNDSLILSDNTERGFVVVCTFSTDTGFGREISAVVDPQNGSSFFKAPAGASRFEFHTPKGLFALSMNSGGEFSGAKFSCKARSHQEARRIFLEGLVPTLDHLAYIAKTPFIISKTLVTDEKHKAFSFGYTTPYIAVVVNPGNASIHVEMMPIYALYREAKNALSPFYSFLCYYKVLEGIYGHLRADVFTKAASAGKQLSTMKERIPNDEELNKNHHELIGRPIKDFFDKELTVDFRKAVAHYFLDNDTLMNVSDPTTVEKFLNILWPIELCCRTVIAQQEQYYDQLASTVI